MPSFQITVQDIDSRAELIKQKRSRPIRKQMFHDHHPSGDDLDVIDLDISVPIYRMANYRTQTYQRAYLHQDGKPPTFFSAGEENVATQIAQHAILVNLAEQGSGESIKPIMDVLANEGGQTEPLLITSTGTIVNGNRRLAAMRELFAQDSTRYNAFRHVQAMVLPLVTDDDIRRMEVRLQMRPETRLPYDWTNQALAVRDLRSHGLTPAEITSLMQLDRERDVQTIIDRLHEGELYLDEYLGLPEEYNELDGREQQFVELQKALVKKSVSIEKELARKLCHVITKHSRQMGIRAYEFKDAYGNHTLKVADKVAERLEIALTASKNDTAAEEQVEDDIFGPVGDDTVVEKDYSQLIRTLSDRSNSDEYAEHIREACVEVREEKDERNKGSDAKKKAEQAFKILGRIDLSDADSNTYDDISQALSGIIEAATELLDEMADIQK